MSRAGVVALIGDPTVSHTAWRCVRPLDALAKVGVPTGLGIVGTEESEDGVVWREQLSSFGLDDSISTLILHRTIVPAEERAAFLVWRDRLRAQGVTVVYDTDDDCYTESWAWHHVDSKFGGLTDDPDSFEAGGEYLMRSAEARQNQWILGQVDGITVSTEHLGRVVECYTDRPVVVLPNAIDVDAFRSGLSSSRLWPDRVTIGWCAGYRPEADGEPVAAAWSRIAERYPEARFVVAGHPLRCLVKAVPADRLTVLGPATMDEYPKGMQVGIGCCSAADSMFNHSRSPIKAWEFALAGAAVVASPTVYGDVTERGLSGLTADTADEWYGALMLLIEDRSQRLRMANRLQERVVREHSLRDNLWRYTDAWAAIRKSAEGVTA